MAVGLLTRAKHGMSTLNHGRLRFILTEKKGEIYEHRTCFSIWCSVLAGNQ